MTSLYQLLRERRIKFFLWTFIPIAVKKDLFSSIEKPAGNQANWNPALLKALNNAYHSQPTPDDIFYYIYAILCAPIYRLKYATFLKIDFPRVPFTRDRKLFQKLVALGRNLVELHLLKSSALSKLICRFEGKGDNRVEREAYKEKEKRVYINKTQYFEGVEQDVWEYQIGGYQVLDKWLKDRRKTRTLNTEDIKHYCRVVTALSKTIAIPPLNLARER